MITILDSNSWAAELRTGGAQFVVVTSVSPPTETIFIVSNVLTTGPYAGQFKVLRSNSVPPDPGPGSSFAVVATGNLGATTIDFDPVVCYDSSTGLLHIVGTMDDPSANPTLTDLVKFTYDTTYLGPYPLDITSSRVTLVTASDIQTAYDICILDSGHKLIAAVADNPSGAISNSPPIPSGQSLMAFELDGSDAYVPNSLVVLASSPPRSGNTVSAVSVLSPDGTDVELYYESHPKVFNFVDQLFSFYVTHRTGATWDASPTPLTQAVGRYTDDRMTVQYSHSSGNRYLSQIYYTQLNHPEGLVGNALLGIQPFSSGSWLFHATPGTVAGGSIVQGDLVESVLTSPSGLELNFVYLLQPFDALPQQPGLPAAYPFRVGLVNTAAMSFTDVPGFYNRQTFTWLRSTKSTMDLASLWAVVGEQEVLTAASEVRLIPATEPYDFLVAHATTFWQDGGVTDNTNNVSYTEVVPPPARGQYSAEPNGLYTFSASDASVGIKGIDLTGGQLTVTGSNIANLQVGTKVLFSGLTHSPIYLNGQIVTVIGTDIARSTFTALFSHADDPEHSDTGLTGKPLTVAYDYVSSIVPMYLSDFNVPPVAEISPIPSVSPPTNVTVYRAQPRTFSAAGSYDRDNDPLEYIWSENDLDAADITLVPSGSTATLTVVRAVGGGLRTFNVGVAVVDLYPDLITERHPPIPVTNIGIALNIITVTANTDLAPGETMMLYGTGIPYVNDLAYTVVAPGPTSFTAAPVVGIIADLSSTPVTGWMIPQYQYAVSTVTVPFNAAPTITFPSPPWYATSPPTYLNVDVPRNMTISISHLPVTSPPVPNQFPVVITGDKDQDDLTTYQWIQLSGTNVLPGTVQPGQTQIIVTTEDLVFHTNGVDLSGESLVFQLTVDDGVNPPAIATCQATVAGYDFLIGTDTERLSRSVWVEQDKITNIAVGPTSNILTVVVPNTFVVGQQVAFSGLAIATFLNGQTVTVDTLIGSGPAYTGFEAYFSYPNQASTADTGFATAAGRVSQRNTALAWAPLDESVLYTDLRTVKRLSVTDGTNRYIAISPYSVLVYGVFGGIPPMTVLLRRLFTPLATAIIDAVHTEDDYTLVLDNVPGDQHIYRYTTTPLINTDNPDTTLDLRNLSSMQFDSIFSTTSHGNVRILALSGPDGCLLVQVANDTLAVQGTLALTTASNLVAGADNVQFVRLSNVESLKSGKVLIGTIDGSGGKTYETLIDLQYGQIIGTWDASKLKNQFVNTGEILFEPDSTYSGRPVSPVLLNIPPPSGGKLTLAWVQQRPDLVSGYSVEYAVRPTASFTLGIGKQYTASNYGSDVGVTESVPITRIQVNGGTLTVTCNNSYATGTPVTLNGLANAAFLNGLPPFIVLGSTGTAFTAAYAHTNYGPTSDLGTSTQALVQTSAMSPLVNQYMVDVTGLYTFNAAQVGNTLTVSFQSPFAALQQVNSGAIQKVAFSIASGSYAFEIQALSNDGASGFSNVQIISF